MGLTDRVVDVTQGSLPLALLQLAWPSVLQAILSNLYTVADFFFVGHLPDKAAAAAGTEGIAASIGLSICLYGFHNIVASGCTAYSAQFKGANDKTSLASCFKAGFWACIALSSLVALLGGTFIQQIAQIPHSTPVVTANIEKFLGILILTSPAFGLLLLIDGFYKSNGNTLVPLCLEISSLIVNLALNYLFVFHLGWGISGSASASALSRLLPALVGLLFITNGHLNGIQVSLFSLSSREEASQLATRAMAMCRLGTWQSMSDWLYGFVFTILIRLSGALGPAEQAGLGAGMRGLEWLSFCVSEGFLVASLTAVGNLIGANLQRRASIAALMSAFMSSACGCLTGLPFIFFSERISRLLSDDADIIKYCAIYIRAQGAVAFGVGFEMAAYGSFIGAGKAREVFLTNGSMNLCRIPVAVYCIFGRSGFWLGLLWALGFSSTTDLPSTVGSFDSICWVIAGTAVLKAMLFFCWLSLRFCRGTYFCDSSLVVVEAGKGTNPVAEQPEAGAGETYIELSQVSSHGFKQGDGGEEGRELGYKFDDDDDGEEGF